MAVVNGYCSVADLRGQFEDGGSKLNAASLERAINAASRAVDDYCGRRFWRDASVTTRTYIPEDEYTLYVDDISTRTGLVVAVGTDGATFPTALTSGTDFLLEPHNADVLAGGDTANAYAFWSLTRLGNKWTTGERFPTVQVTARFGWSAIPDKVQQATLLKAAALFKRRDAPFGVAGFGEFGAVRIARDDPDFVGLLDGLSARAGFA